MLCFCSLRPCWQRLWQKSVGQRPLILHEGNGLEESLQQVWKGAWRGGRLTVTVSHGGPWKFCSLNFWLF